MIETSLVYILKNDGNKAHIGCGAVVNGPFIATCRHVWRDAMGNELDGVIVRFPRADGSGVVHELPARICNHCEEPTGKLDLVILEVQELPEHVHPAAICPAERLEIGKGKIHAYIPTRKEDVTVPGLFSDTTNASGLRQITGDAANGYWTEKGSSGSPAFIDGGVQLAGILRLSELGGVHEAFLIPGTVISVFVKAAARDRHLAELSESKGIDPLQLKPLFEAVEREVPAEQFEPAIRAAVDTLLAKSRDKAQPMNDPLAVAEAINAARAKLAELDVEGALNVLQGEVENQESLRQSAAHSEVRLLLEIADIASKAYQWDRAVAALEKAAPLANDDYSIPVMAGDIHVHQGRLGDALAAFERALETAECSGDQRSVSVSQNRIGDVLRAKGNLAGALEAYKKGLVIAERLAISDASNSEWQRDLSVSHNKIGDVLVAQGDSAGALKAYRDSLAIRKRLAASDASNSEWQRDLSVSHNKIGDVLVAQGDTSGALKAYRDSLAIRERLAASDASNSEWQRDLSVSHDRIGDVLVAQGDTSGALKAYRDGLAIAETLAASDASNSQWQRDLSVSHDRIGNVLVAQGDTAGALKAYRDGLAIAETLAASDASNSQWQRDLSVSHNKIGDVLVEQGDTAGALKAYRDSLAIRERLAASDASNSQWQRDLLVSHFRLADAGDDPVSHYGKALAIARELERSGRLAPVDVWMVSALESRLKDAGGQ